MKKLTTTPVMPDAEHTHRQLPASKNPRAALNIPNKEDKRKGVRHEHTNHFTSREGFPEKK
jgi:hypothetical protein